MTYPLANLILAGIGEVVGGVVAVLVFVIWVVGQILDTKKQMGQPRGRQQPAPRPGQRRPPQPRGQPPMPAAGRAGQQADPLRDQVEAFLRRARGQQQPNQPRAVQRPPQPPATDQIEVLLDDEAMVVERRPLAAPLRPMNQPAGPAQPPVARPRSPRPPRRPAEPLGSGVAEHVTEHISAGSQSLTAHASRLGQRIVTDDEQFDVQLKAKFDHAVGTLASSRVEESVQQAAAPAHVTPAAQIAALLANPEGVRQAIVLNEILRRPDEQWQ